MVVEVVNDVFLRIIHHDEQIVDEIKNLNYYLGGDIVTSYSDLRTRFRYGNVLMLRMPTKYKDLLLKHITDIGLEYREVQEEDLQ